MTTRLSGGLRLFMAVAVMFSVIIPGYLNRSAWIIVLATPAFTVLYALGKWNAWKLAWQTGGMRQILQAIAVTLPIQLVLVAILYMIGLGASMLFGDASGIRQLTSADVVAAFMLFIFATAVSSFINIVEARAGDDRPAPASGLYVLEGEGRLIPAEELELDMDPVPLTPQTFYVSPGYWKPDALSQALEGRGVQVEKRADAASEEAIAAAEARLGVRLPDGLRSLYKILDGGYVGEMYVPLKADPGPVYDDWRGAFSIDYSSLNSLDQLRTVKDHYEDFTDDPDEMPTNADRMIVLQARYQDMTVLDYSDGPEARVRLVDFDEPAESASDIEFPNFDLFFVELRRPRKEKRTSGDRLLAYRKKPVAEYIEAQRPSEFWGADVHAFVNAAKSKGDGSAPKKQADDDLVAETEARLGVTLPPALVELWRYRNGGALAARHFQVSDEGEAYAEIELPEQLMPMEFFATLADVSDRISYPAGETPLKQRHPGAERLVVLEAGRGAALLLDYRSNLQEPAILIVSDLDSQSLDRARRVANMAVLLGSLRAWKRLT